MIIHGVHHSRAPNGLCGSRIIKTTWFVQLLITVIAGQTLASDKASQIHKIVIVGIGDPDSMLPQVRGLYHGLEEAGYVEGKNITIHHFRSGNEAQLRDVLKDMIRRRIEVIVTTSAAETAIAKEITSEVPIVFAPAVDPVGNGLVKSRANPQSNLTGLSYSRDVEDNAKQLTVFKQIVPALRRVTLFYDGRPGVRVSTAALSSIARVARRLDIQLSQNAAVSVADAVAVLERVPRGTTDGVFLICSAVFRGMKPLSDAAARKRVPLFSCTASQVAEEGTLMTYAPDIYYLGYRGAWYIDRILKGAKPAQLPVETPTRFELVINVTNARKIGLAMPPEALMLADKVYE
jgi:putative ABC transport system substrate-binding protein